MWRGNFHIQSADMGVMECALKYDTSVYKRREPSNEVLYQVIADNYPDT